MERRPLRNWEHCEPITETMALFEICASVGVVLKRWISSGGDIGKECGKSHVHMSSSCQNLVAALKECLKHSDCVMKQGHLPSECLKDHYNDLPEECQSLRMATFECKRGMVRVKPAHPISC